MSTENISLSDVGKTLCQLEEEIKSHIDYISYVESEIRERHRKIKLLQETAHALIKNCLPHIVMHEGQMKP